VTRIRQVPPLGQLLRRAAAVEHRLPHLGDLVRIELVDAEGGGRAVQQRLAATGEADQHVARVEQDSVELAHVRVSSRLRM
jgi:hypothetical protein